MRIFKIKERRRRVRWCVLVVCHLRTTSFRFRMLCVHTHTHIQCMLASPPRANAGHVRFVSAQIRTHLIHVFVYIRIYIYSYARTRSHTHTHTLDMSVCAESRTHTFLQHPSFIHKLLCECVVYCILRTARVVVGSPYVASARQLSCERVFSFMKKNTTYIRLF